MKNIQFSHIVKLLFAVGFILSQNLASGQSCPTNFKRNNGQGTKCGTTASSVSGTIYANVPTSTKQGTLTLTFDSSINTNNVPAIEGAYIGSSRIDVDFGPPSEPNSKGEVTYCFYKNNLQPANAFTIRFVNPSPGSSWSNCTYTGGSSPTPISVSTDISDVVKCSGQSLTWSVTSSPSGATYQWYKNGTVITGETSSSLDFTSITSSDAGTYYCEVSDGSNWTYTSESGTLTVNTCPPNLTNILATSAVNIDGTTGDHFFTFTFEFDQAINTTTLDKTDFTAYLDGTEARAIHSATPQSGSSTKFDVIVDLDENDEGELEINLSSSNDIKSSIGASSLVSNTPTNLNNNTFNLGGDGISAAIEDAVSNGDRNGDGKKDKHQNNISTFPWKNKPKFDLGASASVSDFVTLSVGGITTSTAKNLDKNLKITNVDVLETMDSYFNSVQFPAQLTTGAVTQDITPVYDPIYFKIEANGNSFSSRDLDSRSGTQIRVYFDLPDGGEAFNSYMKWNSIDQEWYEFLADGNLSTYDDGAEFFDTDADGVLDRIVLTITEGDAAGGDADGIVNNIILDPGTIVSSNGPTYTGNTEFSILEGNTSVGTLTATNGTDWQITSFSGYEGASIFSVDQNTGALTFNSAPDFENPSDLNADNVYMLRVAIEDASSNQTIVDIEVTVLDVWESDQNDCPTLIVKNPGGNLNSSYVYASGYTGITTSVGTTGYIEFEFSDIPTESSLPRIENAFVNGSIDNLVEFDDPKVFIGNPSSNRYLNSGKVWYVWHGASNNNFSTANTFQLLFDNGSIVDITDLNASCGYSSSGAPLNNIDWSENYSSTNIICEGSSESFSITSATANNGGTITYQWQKLNTTSNEYENISTATTATLTLSPVAITDAGTYRCLLLEVDGSSPPATIIAATTSAFTVTVNTLPTISGTTTVCVDATTDLDGSGTPASSNPWTSSSTGVATIDDDGVVTAVSAGTATITYTDGNGCSVTSIVTVETTPSAALSNAAPSICESTASYSLDLTSVVGAPDLYRIDYASTSLTDISATSFTGTSLSIAIPTTTAGTYTGNLYVQNSTTTCESAAIPFTITIDAIPSATLAVSDATICTGSSASITVTSSESGYSYQLRDDSNDNNVGSAVLGTGGDITFSVSPTASTTYNVYVTNGNCAVELTDKPIVTVDAASVGGTLYENGTTNTSVTVTGGSNTTDITLSGETGSVVQWESSSDNSFTSPTVIANTSNNYTSLNVNSTTYYRALIQNGSCSSTYSSTFTVSTNALPTFTLSSNADAQCPGSAGSLTITAKSSGADQYRIDWDAAAESAGFSDVTLTTIPGTNILPLAANATAGTYNATVYVKNSSTGLESNGTSITFTVNALPVLSNASGTNPTTCSGSNGSFTFDVTNVADGTYTVIYDNGSASASVSSGTATVIGLSAGTYANLSITNGNSCTGTSTLSVTLSDPAAPMITGTTSVCVDATTDLDGSGTPASSNPWTSSDVTVATINDNGLVTAVSAGTTTITYTDNNGCSATETVTVNALPVLSNASGTNPTTCSGSNGSFTFYVTNVADGTYTVIYDNGSASASVSSGTATVIGLSAGTYANLSITNGNSCTGTSTLSVTLSDPAAPMITGTTSVCVDATTDLDGSGTPASSNPWTSSDVTVATINDNGLVTAVSAGTTTITYTDNNGCSATETVTVNALPVLSNASGTNPTTCSGSNGSFTFDVTNVADGTYTVIYDNGSASASVSSGTATVIGLSAGTYANLSITNGNSCTGTSTLSVTLSDPAAPMITGTTSVCVDATTDLDGSGTPASSNPWTSSDVTVATINDNGLVTAVSAGTTTITYTDNNGCSATETVTVNALPVLSNASGTNPTTCSGSNGSFTFDVTNVADGTYTVIYDNGSASASVSSGTATVIGLSAGTYANLSITNGNSCTGTSTLSVTLSDPAAPMITGTTSVCVDATTDLDGSGTPASSNPWTSSDVTVATINDNGLVTAVSAGTTTITYTDNNGCSATETVTVNALPVLSNASGTNPTTCSGSNGSFTFDVTNVADGTYTVIYDNGSASASVSSGTATVIGLSAGTYANLSITNGNSCTGTSTLSVTLSDPAAPMITGTTSVCVDATTDLDGSGTPASSNPWTSSDVTVATINDNGLVTAVSAGTTTITYTDNNGCSATETVTVNALPVLSNASGTNPTTCSGSNGSFTFDVTNVADGTYTVIYDNGSASASVSSGTDTVIGLSAGTYANLSITNGNSCTGTSTLSVTLSDPAAPMITGTTSVCVDATTDLDG